jgi:hypothetical protein
MYYGSWVSGSSLSKGLIKPFKEGSGNVDTRAIKCNGRRKHQEVLKTGELEGAILEGVGGG